MRLAAGETRERRMENGGEKCWSGRTKEKFIGRQNGRSYAQKGAFFTLFLTPKRAPKSGKNWQRKTRKVAENSENGGGWTSWEADLKIPDQGRMVG